MLETIEQTVKPRDRYEVEVKLDYELLGDKKTRYKISTFLFMPRSLDISPSTFRKDDFYRETKNYIRLKTPQFNLNDFLVNPTSPLVTIRDHTTNPEWHLNAESDEVLLIGFKFLAVMLRTALREHINLIAQRIHEAKPDSKVHVQVGHLVESFLVDSHRHTN